jgi:ATP-dependent Clp protease ATP-binding subunit ClpC
MQARAPAIPAASRFFIYPFLYITASRFFICSKLFCFDLVVTQNFFEVHMPTYRFPVLIWEDFEGYFTAKLIEYEHNFYLIYGGKYVAGTDRAPTGIGRTADDALYQVKEYLAWSYEQYPWQPAPDFLEPRLIHFKVLIRPEYRVEDRVYPCDEQISLRVACIHGRQENGLLVAVLPVLGIRFYYYEPKSLKELVNHYVQERLKGMSPRELSRQLPPKNIALDGIVLHINQKEKKDRDLPELKNLKSVAEPLGDKSLRRRFSRAWERESEVADLVQRISKERANVILVGESGVGKTAVLVEAVRQIERQLQNTADDDDDDEANYQYKFWLTSGARLIAGMQYLGQWEERCESVISELSDIGGVLCVDNLLDLARTGGRSSSDSIAMFLLPYLQRAELRLMAEATPAELDACRRLLPGFADLFQILNISQFIRTKAISVLDRAATSLKRNMNVNASEGIVDLVYRLFNRFVPYQAFPGKTISFLSDIFERAGIEKAGEVTNKKVIEQFVRRTGLPELFLRDDMVLDFAEVLETFRKQVIGQQEACNVAANLVTTFKAGLNDPNRPVGVLLFCGPTGVGKTELAKSISRFFFGSGEQQDRLIRLDMSEYSSPGAAERFLGEPDGEPSALIKRVRQQPFVVLLLDEIEKANPEIFDLLLSLFDEGRLTDRYGRTTIFRSAMIVMTSNIGADKFDAIGFGKQQLPSYTSEAMSFFRPEFYNRIDMIVRFEPLDQNMILAITKKELNEISQREGLTKAGIRLNWTEGLVERLSRAGFDPRYGARPLQRAIETTIVAPLARYLNEHQELKNVLIQIDLDTNEQVAFTIKSM